MKNLIWCCIYNTIPCWLNPMTCPRLICPVVVATSLSLFILLSLNCTWGEVQLHLLELKYMRWKPIGHRENKFVSKSCNKQEEILMLHFLIDFCGEESAAINYSTFNYVSWMLSRELFSLFFYKQYFSIYLCFSIYPCFASNCDRY